MKKSYEWKNYKFSCQYHGYSFMINYEFPFHHYCKKGEGNSNLLRCSEKLCRNFQKREKQVWDTTTISISTRKVPLVSTCKLYNKSKLTNVIKELIKKKLTGRTITSMKVHKLE